MLRAEGEVLIDAAGGPTMATAVMQAIQRRIIFWAEPDDVISA